MTASMGAGRTGVQAASSERRIRLPPMGSDVFGGGTADRWSFMRIGLITFGVMVILAATVVVESDPRQPLHLYVPGLLGAGLFSLVMWGWAIPRIGSTWHMEIGPDVIRWHGGFRRDRVVHRAQVHEIKTRHTRYDVWLVCYDGAGDRVGTVPLSKLGPGRVVKALHRHGWPIHSEPGSPSALWTRASCAPSRLSSSPASKRRRS